MFSALIRARGSEHPFGELRTISYQILKKAYTPRSVVHRHIYRWLTDARAHLQTHSPWPFLPAFAVGLSCILNSPQDDLLLFGKKKKKKKRRKGKCSIPEALGSTTSAAGAPPAACPAHAPFKGTRLTVNWIEAKERSGSLLSFLGLFCNGKARNRNKLASFIAHLIPWSLQLETDCPWKQASRRASYPRGIFQSQALLGRVAFVRFFCGSFPESRPCCVTPSSCLSSPNG